VGPLRRTPALLLALAVVAWDSACRQPPPSTSGTPAPPAPSDSRTPDPEAIERLRSLGYAGVVPEDRADPRDGVVVHERASFPGYRFFTIRDFCAAVLVDSDGKVANSWSEAPCERWANAEMLPSGDVLVVGRDPHDRRDLEQVTRSRFLMKLSWQGKVLWKWAYPSQHDVEPLPTGQLLTLWSRYRVIPDVDPVVPVRDDGVALLGPDGAEQESLSFYDLYKRSPEGADLQHARGSREIDLFHSNSVEWGPGGTVLVSLRHQDSVLLIDWAKRRIVWSWGRGELAGPHDATRLADGHVLVFDNGLGRGYSRVVEFDPASRRIVWQYQAPNPTDFYTLSRGSCQRLPNGNTLISESDRGRAFEVTPKGQVVWEFFSPARDRKGRRATTVRMRGFAAGLVQEIVRRHGPGRTSLPPPPANLGSGPDDDAT
jgi:arylsulfotransferase ASST